MVPNVFISSTVADLQYLRDALRDAIEELRYHPIMSEHGEVGYLRPSTAPESCYRTVQQCQMVILIVGKRYGSVGSDALSITHREYRSARDKQIPIITFVESQVIHYKEVFDTARNADIWKSFEKMDNPSGTFGLLDEIACSPMYNALVPFSSVADAKEKLKLQIADFVGERLGETISPMGQQVKDILAEIKTLRNQLTQNEGSGSNAKKYLAATRYLLNDTAASYRSFLDSVFGDIDAAVEKVVALPSLDEVVGAAGYKLEKVPDGTLMARVRIPGPPPPLPDGGQLVTGSYFGPAGGYELYTSRVILIAESTLIEFSRQQERMYAKVAAAK
jgi:hypothetical protein